MSWLTDQVSELRIESRWTPAIIVRDPFGASAAPPSPVGAFLRPKVTMVAAGVPLSAAPYGEPGATQWPKVRDGFFYALVIVAAVAIAAKARRE